MTQFCDIKRVMENGIQSDPLDQKSVIYLITNTANGKKYVGQTIGVLRKRWKGHRKDLRKKQAISLAIRKYGEDSFSIDVIEKCDTSILNEREAHWISEFGTMSPLGYNLRPGGNNSSLSTETKDKISLSKSGKKLSEEHRAKIGNAHRGTKHKSPPKEHLVRMGLARLGTKHSEETKAKIGAAHRGKKRREGTGAKISASLMGKKHSDEARAKISASKTGKPQSPEHIAARMAWRLRENTVHLSNI